MQRHYSWQLEIPLPAKLIATSKTWSLCGSGGTSGTERSRRSIRHGYPYCDTTAGNRWSTGNTNRRAEEWVPPDDCGGVVDALTAIHPNWTPGDVVEYSFRTSTEPVKLAIRISSDYPVALTVSILEGPKQDSARNMLRDIYNHRQPIATERMNRPTKLRHEDTTEQTDERAG